MEELERRISLVETELRSITTNGPFMRKGEITEKIARQADLIDTIRNDIRTLRDDVKAIKETTQSRTWAIAVIGLTTTVSMLGWIVNLLRDLGGG